MRIDFSYHMVEMYPSSLSTYFYMNLMHRVLFMKNEDIHIQMRMITTFCSHCAFGPAVIRKREENVYAYLTYVGSDFNKWIEYIKPLLK